MKVSSACFAVGSWRRAMPWAEAPWTACVVFGSRAALPIVMTAVLAAMSLPPARKSFGSAIWGMSAVASRPPALGSDEIVATPASSAVAADLERGGAAEVGAGDVDEGPVLRLEVAHGDVEVGAVL